MISDRILHKKIRYLRKITFFLGIKSPIKKKRESKGLKVETEGV